METTKGSDPLGSPQNRPNSLKSLSLTCSGHTRPVVDVSFSPLLEKEQNRFFIISACKGKYSRSVTNEFGEEWDRNRFLDGLPMMREGMTGDWIGTFSGHKGAVWCARLNEDATKAVTASADFTT
jgi:serine-threonine kinase receptor-associated protein